MKQLQQFRHQIDQFMAHHPQSPLPPHLLDGFEGLNYYAPNPDLVLELTVEPIENGDPVTVQTSDGDERTYRRWGRVTFEVDGQPATLTILGDMHGHGLFLPFRDTTSGKETYGAGRYMDEDRPAIQRIGRGRVRLDFNYAYNPYCAYSPDYSCPLPPHENWLSVPIRAGEQAFAA